MKIRFWHWWIYRLYSWAWSPILTSNPAMVWGMTEYQKRWLKRRAPPLNTDELVEQVLTEQMCQNCITPWKCNGPHIPMEKK